MATSTHNPLAAPSQAAKPQVGQGGREASPSLLQETLPLTWHWEGGPCAVLLQGRSRGRVTVDNPETWGNRLIQGYKDGL